MGRKPIPLPRITSITRYNNYMGDDDFCGNIDDVISNLESLRDRIKADHPDCVVYIEKDYCDYSCHCGFNISASSAETDSEYEARMAKHIAYLEQKRAEDKKKKLEREERELKELERLKKKYESLSKKVAKTKRKEATNESKSN